MKRIIAVILSLILIFSLVGCGKQKREIIKLTLSTEDSEAILAAAGIRLPAAETTAASGTNVKWFAWWDDFHNYSDDEIVQTGFWTFQEKYGCDVEWIECTWSDRFDGLANLTLSGEAPDFAPNDLGSFPVRTMKGMYQAVDDYVDYSDPLWEGVKDFVYKYLSLNGKAYMFVTDITYGDVCVYNRRVMEEWGFDDPAELYYNDEWTWDVFYNMCMDFSDPDDDRYALDSWSFSAGLMRSTGIPVVEYDTETRTYVDNTDSPELERAANLLYDIAKNNCVYPWWNNGWSLRGSSEGEGINSGKMLIFIGYDYTFTGPVDNITPVFGDIAGGEIMYCPMPRDANGDGHYYTESSPTGYFLVNGAQNPEGVALLAACQRFKVLDPTVVSIDKKQKEEIYLWTDEMLNMYDIMHDIANSENMIVTGFGYDNALASVISAYEDNGHVMNASTWAQIKESNSEKLKYYLDELNTQVKEYENANS